MRSKVSHDSLLLAQIHVVYSLQFVNPKFKVFAYDKQQESIGHCLRDKNSVMDDVTSLGSLIFLEVKCDLMYSTEYKSSEHSL